MPRTKKLRMLSSACAWMGICNMNEATGKIETAPPLKIVIVSHVDHGKSTLIGRLFHETGTLPEGKLKAIQEMCRRRGMLFEWAFVLDAVKAERDQGVTIDAAHIRFRTEKRNYVLIDALGNREFLKNMITGAASADAAVLVVDTLEGVQEQTRRHGYLLHLMSVHQVVVVMNKMDLVDWSESRYQEVAGECKAYIASLGLDVEHMAMVPISAREGDGISARSTKMDWYEGPTVVEALENFQPPLSPLYLPLRFPVQDIYKFDERRLIAGRIESGHLSVGDELIFSPSGKSARVASFESWGDQEPVMSARAGQSVAITLDDHIFVERGEMASSVSKPPILSYVFQAHIFWLGRNPLTVGKSYKLKINSVDYQVEVDAIERVIDVADLSGKEVESVKRNDVAEVVLRSRSLMTLDEFNANNNTGRFVLVEDYDIVGGGLIIMEGYADQRDRFNIKSTNISRIEHRISARDRGYANGHNSGILWLTGLSGSGKSTLAFSLEQCLFRKGYHVYVLDGDNIRHGLCSDLAFSPEDRSENIRRVGEAAKLFADAGFLVVTAFISPYRSDRDQVRASAPNLFHEVYVNANIEECERRDPKGLYIKARRGEILEFTGVSAPYEAPVAPELELDTEAQSVEESLHLLAQYATDHFSLEEIQVDNAQESGNNPGLQHARGFQIQTPSVGGGE